MVVANSASSPVPVTSTTRVLYASGPITDGIDQELDVSSCSRIRITTELEKEGGADASLWDETSGGVGARLIDIPLGDYYTGGNPPYASAVLDVPGTTLMLYLRVVVGTTMATTVYCT